MATTLDGFCERFFPSCRHGENDRCAVRLYRVVAELYIDAPWKDQFDEAVADYLRRSREEITEQEEWTFLHAAMQEKDNPGLMLAVAVSDDDEQLLGFALFRDLPGIPSVGRILQIWQVYAWPGRARLVDIFKKAEPWIEVLAKQFGFTRAQVYTRRITPAYQKLLARLGFVVDGVTYQRPLKGGK